MERLLPGLWRLRHYQRGWLRGDVIAGVTVAAYLVPQVMAYAEVAGLPAIVGLWAVVAPLAVYAILGSSNQLSVGPESTTALMTAAAVGAMVAGSPGRYAETAAALAIAVGVLCILGWIGRLGFLANLLSRPVLVGYLAGIAVLMVISQLGKITRIDVVGGSSFDEVRSFLTQLDQTHLPTLALAVGVLIFLFVLQRWFPRLPGPLIAMLLAAGVVVVFHLDQSEWRSSATSRAACPPRRCPTSAGSRWPHFSPPRSGSPSWATPTMCSRLGRSPPNGTR